MPYAYKAVRVVRPGVYRSLYDVHPVTYRMGETTKALKGTGLICYKPGSNYSEASINSKEIAGERILLRVRVSGRVPLTRERLSVSKRPTTKELKQFWAGKDVPGMAGYWDWYVGSIAYVEVTPLYVVDMATMKRMK